MNAVEIEEAVSELASEPFDAAEFPYSFLKAFGNKDTTIARLRSGASNASDIPNGVLQRSNIHIATCAVGSTTKALVALKLSPKTAQSKARYVLATDGATVEAEDLATGETIACPYGELADRFAFFLPLAGISTIKQLRESSFDVRATGRLNKLYLELRRHNPSWDKSDRQHDMNHFMARLIFCFFAEDTDIFHGKNMFSQTIEQMSAPDASNAHEVIETIFRAMNLKHSDRAEEKVPRWADAFPYVNGGLFSGSTEVPRFTKMARIYLLHIGNLEWRKINPDIFGSMIQAVTDDDERGALGMHYTSVPNILKVLNPLFLDDLREKLEEAGENARVLLNLRKRISRIRVFDPACGSGNFLVIAYKQMREIEAEINKRRGEDSRKSDIPITNFRGIEIRDFPAEIARLALIIAEFQCDTLYLGQKEALQEFLPLDTENWITCGNALRLDWFTVCPPTGSAVKFRSDDLFSAPFDQAQIAFENEGGEVYISGNPPYTGFNRQSESQKDDMAAVFGGKASKFGNLDYACCWFAKAAMLNNRLGSRSAFVVTNSICQGSQVPVIWPFIFSENQEIYYARTSFKWSNLASHNAGITVIVVGMQNRTGRPATLFIEDDGEITSRVVSSIGPYLVPNSNVVVEPRRTPLSDLPIMTLGNHPYYASELIVDRTEAQEILKQSPSINRFIRPYLGSSEIIKGVPRFCIWVTDSSSHEAAKFPELAQRFDQVRNTRQSKTKDTTAQSLVAKPYRFRDQATANERQIVIPQVSSERREYLPVDLVDRRPVISFQAYSIFDGPLWAFSIVCSKLHWNWIAAVCRRMRTDFSYSNTLGWNTFPLPTLTEQNKRDLTESAEGILLARESLFPETIADLYDPDGMSDKLRAAHEHNDEILERIYIGRRFRNDTERLEKLFELYTRMVAKVPAQDIKRKRAKVGSND